MLSRFQSLLTLPRAIGLFAIALGFAHYVPLPTLPILWLVDLHEDIAPELIGIGVTVILIDWALARQAKIERKTQLIRQFRSKYRDVTEMARIELEHEGWLRDGSLSDAFLWGTNLNGANLGGSALRAAELRQKLNGRPALLGADVGDSWLGANLSGAFLGYADLSGANLRRANLRKAQLLGANLSEAVLEYTDLSGAGLARADLSGAGLRHADLSEAYMLGANLSGAYMLGANLSGAFLGGANLNGANLWGSDLSGAIVSSEDRWEGVIVASRTLRWFRD